MSCIKCELADTVPYNTNPDEVFLEFLYRYDKNRQVDVSKKDDDYTKDETLYDVKEEKIHDNDDDLATESTIITSQIATSQPTKKITVPKNEMIREESEIKKMIGDEKPDRLTRSVLYSQKDYLADYRVIREPEPEYGQSPDKIGLDIRLVKVLQKIGIKRFYKFQYEAIKSIMSGNDTVIEAPTASGKTEAFLVPIIQNIIDSEKNAIKNYNAHEDNHSDGNENHIRKRKNKRCVHAIFVYPTKALAKDQLPKIQNMANAVKLTVEILDGDTDTTERNRILSNPPHILVTNFDLLHHQMWRQTRLSKILRTFKILVVDEAHTYSGIFGSNVHYVIKRLARISDTVQFGKSIQYVASSATLNNAEQFCTELFGINKITQIQGLGPKRHIEFAMIFPSLRKPRVLMSDLTKKFATSGHQTMAFSNSHRGSELLAIRCQRDGVSINVHRAGLMPKQRIATEKLFKSGKLQAISCTPTLELGIDVGSTDCVVSAPTPINRLIQRIGRAARKGKRRGYAFLALGDDPISQYYKNHPADYFEDVERLYIDTHNPYIEECQILAMAHDMPIRHDEYTQYADIIERLVSRGELKRTNDKTIIPNKSQISETKVATSVNNQTLVNYSIRGMGESVDIVYNGTKVGDRVCPIALDELYKGAVYFLAGRSYIVNKFDYPKMQHAIIEKLPYDHPYYTKALTSEYPYIEKIIEKRMVNGIETAFCKLRIEKTVSGYVKTKWKNTYDATNEIMTAQEYDNNVTDDGTRINDMMTGKTASSEIIKLDKPLFYTYATKGIAFCAPCPSDEIQKAGRQKESQQQQHLSAIQNPKSSQGTSFVNKLDEEYITASGYHATEHIIIEGSNMITGGASQNLGGISMGTSGVIFVHDGVIGGSGASRALYDRLELAFERGMNIVNECPCTAESGCPRCIMSYRCGNNNQYLHKMASLEILKRINRGESTTLVLDSFEHQEPIV